MTTSGHRPAPVGSEPAKQCRGRGGATPPDAATEPVRVPHGTTAESTTASPAAAPAPIAATIPTSTPITARSASAAAVTPAPPEHAVTASAPPATAAPPTAAPQSGLRPAAPPPPDTADRPAHTELQERSVNERLTALLDDAGATYRLIAHPPEGRTVEASALRGHPPAQGAKSLVVVVRPNKRTRRHILAVIPGDRRVDLLRIAESAGARKAGFADRETAEELAGSASGTIVPFSFRPELEVLVDEDLLEHDILYFNAARLDLSMALATKDYLRVVNPRTARISEPPVG